MLSKLKAVLQKNLIFGNVDYKIIKKCESNNNHISKSLVILNK